MPIVWWHFKVVGSRDDTEVSVSAASFGSQVNISIGLGLCLAAVGQTAG